MTKTKYQQGRADGFSLIELMIAVAIIGIIGAIAYPSYTEYVKKSRRADAQGALVSFAGAMERHFTVHGTYCGAGDTDDGGCTKGKGNPTIFAGWAPVDGPEANAYYDLKIESASPTTFVLHAIPTGVQSGDSCGTLTITQAGTRGAATSDCWP